jgi:O-antigen/teichoic acid export membrane protein
MILRGISSSLLAKFLGPVLGFGTIGLISELYGPGEVGLYSSLMQLIIVLGVFSRAGSDFVLMKSLSNFSTGATNVWIIKKILPIFVVALFLTLSLVLVIFDYFDWPIFNVLVNQRYLVIYCVGISSIYVFALSILIARNSYLASTVLQSIITPAAILLSIFCLSYVESSLLVTISLGYSISLLACVLYIGINLGCFESRSTVMPSGYSSGLSVSISEAVFYNSDLLILSFYVPFADLGVYAIATRLATLYGFYVQISNIAIIGDVSSMIKYGEKASLASFKRAFIKRNFLFGALYVVALLSSACIVPMLIGEEYSMVFDYALWLSLPGFLGCLYGSTSNFRFLFSDSANKRDGHINMVFMVLYGIIFLYVTSKLGVDGAIMTVVLLKSIYYVSFNLRLNRVIETYAY